jgi:hypothetical protein
MSKISSTISQIHAISNRNSVAGPALVTSFPQGLASTPPCSQAALLHLVAAIFMLAPGGTYATAVAFRLDAHVIRLIAMAGAAFEEVFLFRPASAGFCGRMAGPGISAAPAASSPRGEVTQNVDGVVCFLVARSRRALDAREMMRLREVVGWNAGSAAGMPVAEGLRESLVGACEWLAERLEAEGHIVRDLQAGESEATSLLSLGERWGVRMELDGPQWRQGAWKASKVRAKSVVHDVPLTSIPQSLVWIFCRS